MRIVTWNLNHKTFLQDIPHDAIHALLSLRPDILVLTEYVHGPTRERFQDTLASHGIGQCLISGRVPGENQVLIASRSRLEPGPIRAPAIAPSVPSNALHTILPDQQFEILGIRVPDYSKDARTKRACWDWIERTAVGVSARPFVMIGDFNTDPSYPSSRCGDRIGKLVASGWQLAAPMEGASYWTMKENLPRRIDHAFLSRHFTVTDTRYVTDFDGRRVVGHGRGMLSDHAILQVDFQFIETDGDVVA
jgi:endonuclease/exonuclease/phosphatase family metal-dependent hydrolase